MPLTEHTANDKIEVVQKDGYSVVNVRTATIIKKDGVEISRGLSRRVIGPLDDFSGEPEEVSAICSVVFTQDMIDYCRSIAE